MTSLPSPKSALIKGAAWTIALRWSVKGLGFLNTVIMARILVPADYGIVAMAFLVLGIVQALLDFGAATALLRKGECTRSEIDSAWTLRLLQSAFVGLLLIAMAPLAVLYFSEPRVEWVLWVLGTCVIVSSAGNIGPILAQKEFNFSLDFKIQVTQKLLAVVVTILMGLILHDYRALVAGVVVAYAAPLVLSYVWHPYRPRWDTSRIPEIWAVTKWLMFAGVGSFILRKGDELAAARIGTTTEFGQYNVGSDLGQLPVGEVGPAMLRALLPVLASIKDDAERTRQAVIKTISALNTVIWPIGLGFAALSEQITELILGARWAGSAIFVGSFAIVAVLQTTLSPLNTLLVLQGHTRTQMLTVWFEFGVFVVAAILLAPQFHLLGLVYARIFGSIANLSATVILAKIYCHTSGRHVFAALLRPILGSLMMFFIVNKTILHFGSITTQIFILALTGASFFTVWSLLTWKLSGCPEGLESTCYDFINTKIKEHIKRR